MRTSWIIVASFLSVVSIVYLYLKNRNKKAKEEYNGRIGSVAGGSNSNATIQRAIRYNEQEKPKIS